MAFRLDREQDTERLRQAALLLEAENAKLIRRNLALQRALLVAQGVEGSALQLRLAELERQLQQKNAELFGRSSEKSERSSGKGDKPERAPQKGHGPREQKVLPIAEVPHALDVADMTCPACGGELTEWAGETEDSEEIDVVERRFVLKKHLRKKYRCGCHGCVETAPAPLKLQEGGRYSVDFAIEVAVQKHVDHLPLERQVKMMAREGLLIDSQTLWDQLSVLARLLQPTYDALYAEILREPVLGADETRWPLLGSEGQARWHAWALASQSAVVYRIFEGRGADAARALLLGFKGKLVTDGFPAYVMLGKECAGDIVLCHCWAHVRRRLMECADPKAQPGLELIGQLYAVEREWRDGPREFDRLLALRQSKSRDIVSRIHAWALEVRVLPESALGKALAYMGHLWTGLVRFLEDPRVALDNNATERAIRGPVVGRKNHYGSRSRRGTEVAALFYSLLESAKLADVEPKAYLRAAVAAARASQPPLLPASYAAAARTAIK
jgi:transposase